MLKFPVKPTALFLLLLYGAILGGVTGCAPEENNRFIPGGKTVYAEPAERVDPRLVGGNTGFACALFKALYQREPAKNIFISPASVSLALGMTYNGAAGKTAEAMGKVLGFEGMGLQEINTAFADLRTILQNPDPKVKLALANSLWAREGVEFDESFLERNRDFFDARIEALDFGRADAAKSINRWVEKQTGGRIKDLIEPPIDPLTVMFLINAIYLKADWSEPFDPKQTMENPFYLLGGGSKDHPIMFQGGNFQYLKDEGFQAAFLPYGKNGRIGMYIFLPDPGQTLTDFYSRLDSEHWASWMGSFKEMEGTVGLPRFKFEYEASLKDVLEALGMEIAFDPNAADFRAMAPADTELFIAEVKHKAFVEVDEKGTEAAAATSVECRCTSAAPDEEERFALIADRPFFFSIVDQMTGSVLFMGSLSDPQL